MKQSPETVILRLNNFRKELLADLPICDILLPPAHITDTLYACYLYVAKTSGWAPGEVIDLLHSLYI